MKRVRQFCFIFCAAFFSFLSVNAKASIYKTCEKDSKAYCSQFPVSDGQGILTCLRIQYDALSGECKSAIKSMTDKQNAAYKKAKAREEVERGKGNYEPGWDAEKVKAAELARERVALESSRKKKEKDKKIEAKTSAQGNLTRPKTPLNGGYNKKLEGKVLDAIDQLRKQRGASQ